jgi:RNA polymerase sigma-70 factor (ECF subfamily)
MTLPAFSLAFGGPPPNEEGSGSAAGRSERAHGAPLTLATPSDDALVARTRAGDREAFEQLVRRYHVRLVAAAHAALHERAEAEDLVQDVLLRIWVNHTTWTPASGAAVYFFGAVANRVRNVWRDRMRAQRLSALAQQDAEQHTRIADDMTGIWDAVAELPERWRTAIVLRFARDSSFAEVGAAMGISENAAKKVVRRALAALLEAVQES